MKEKFDGLDSVLALNIALGAFDQIMERFDIPPALFGLLSKSEKALGSISEFALTIKTKKINHIIMVGCGGTGSHLLPNVLQFVYSNCNKSNLEFPRITLIDGDVVEEKNLVRQKFTSADLGKNKAEALAERYAQAFGLNIAFIDGWLKQAKMLTEIVEANTNVLIIGAVDNHQARLTIYDFFMTPRQGRVYWVDCGNETWHGQAIVGISQDPDEKTDFQLADMNTESVLATTPSFFQVFPGEVNKALEPLKPRNECARIVEENPQTIQANMMSAYCGTALSIQVLSGELRSMDITFDALSGNTKATIITQSRLFEAQVKNREAKKILKDFFSTLVANSAEPEVEEKRLKEFFPSLYNVQA